MTTTEKKERVRALVLEMLEDAHKWMLADVERIIHCSAIDIDAWDAGTNPMVLPKTIIAAALQKQAANFDGNGTSFATQVQKDVRNIRRFV